jgi:hypothetical protein
MKKKVSLVGLLALAASAAFMPSAMAVPNGNHVHALPPGGNGP